MFDSHWKPQPVASGGGETGRGAKQSSNNACPWGVRRCNAVANALHTNGALERLPLDGRNPFHSDTERIAKMSSTLPTMMTIRQVAETGLLKEHTLRLMLKQNKVPGVIYVGKRALINVDKLVAYLNNEEVKYIEGC